MTRLFLVLLLVALVGTPAALAQPAASGAISGGDRVILNDRIPREMRDVEVDQKLGEPIPTDVPMINSEGRKVVLRDLLANGKPLLLSLNYSNCPMLCNVQLNQLSQSLQELGLQFDDDFRMLSVSIDPAETDQRLAEMKQRYIEQIPNQKKAAEGWTFARASQPQITRLAEATGFSYRLDPNTGDYAHPAMLAFISPDGVITRYNLGVAFPADDLKLAIVEAGRGNVGGVVDQFVLWCYSYDPEANSYVAASWRLMRLGGALTVIVMLLCLLPYWVTRERKPNQSNEHPTLQTIRQS